MKIIKVDNFDSFKQLYDQYMENKDGPETTSLLMLFVGADDPQTLKSWCSDCRNCEETFNKVFDKFKYNEQLALAIVSVGQRDEWKDGSNPFRTHVLNITSIPTLVSLKTVSMVSTIFISEAAIFAQQRSYLTNL